MAEQQKLSPEELKRRKQELVSFWKEEIGFLKIRKEYETLLAELDEIQLRRMMIQVKAANIMAQPPQNNESSEPEETPDMPNVPTNKVATESSVEEQETSHGLSEEQIRKLKKS